MDPNTALDSILTGCMVVDHAEALSEWLARDGFVPAVRQLPEHDNCAVFVREHIARHYHGVGVEDFTTIRVRADRHGLWTAPEGGRWISLGIWPELLRMADDE